MHIPLIYEHLFYKYFVRWSVGQATKSKRASLLMDVVILVFLSTSILILEAQLLLYDKDMSVTHSLTYNVTLFYFNSTLLLFYLGWMGTAEYEQRLPTVWRK